MVAQAVAVAAPATSETRYDEARCRLRAELQQIADNVQFLDPDRPEWKPLLDSRRVVGTVLVLENLFPDVRIPPDRLVRKGGYNDVDTAADDVIRNHRRIAAELAQKKRM